MKKHSILQTTKSAILSIPFGLLVGLSTSHSEAEDITIINEGFEEFTTGGEFTFPTPFGWDRYNPYGLVFGNGNDFYDGALNLSVPGSPWFNEPAPEGDNVLLLYSVRNADNVAEFGVQQTLTETIQGNSLYIFSVSVGNIQSGADQNGNYGNFDGFPGYRVQILAGGTVIYDDLNGLNPAEGEFLVSDCSFIIPSNSTLIGQEITIRLTNLNLTGGGPTPDEVNFDNVQLSREPLGVVKPALVPAEINSLGIAEVSKGDSGLVQNFTITGKGKKKVLITGRGMSHHDRVPNRIADPEISVYGRKGLVGTSANWMEEKQAKQISKTPQFGKENWHRNDAATILELSPGEYSIELKNADGREGYGSIEVYDLDRAATAKIEIPDKTASELAQIWN